MCEVPQMTDDGVKAGKPVMVEVQFLEEFVGKDGC